jgi:hypothetical protein
MTDESDKDQEEEKTITASVSAAGADAGSVTISYASGFPKQQLGFATRARDRAGKIEATFVDDHLDKIPEYDSREHQRNVISALINSLGFLEGQKYWFIYRLEDRDWDFENVEEIQQTGWNGVEDAFIRMLEVSHGNSDILKDLPVYDEIKAPRKFRNDILHFESPKVRAGNESEEYDVDGLFENLDYAQNPIAPNNTYPFKWLSYDLAETSVQRCFTYWRFFARGLDMEDEFLQGVPRP